MTGARRDRYPWVTCSGSADRVRVLGRAVLEGEDARILDDALADLDRAADRLAARPTPAGPAMTTGRYSSSASLFSHVAEFHRNDGLWSTA